MILEQLTRASGRGGDVAGFHRRLWKAELPRRFIVWQRDRAQQRRLADVTACRLATFPSNRRVEVCAIAVPHSPFLRPVGREPLLLDATTNEPFGPLKPNGWLMATVDCPQPARWGRIESTKFPSTDLRAQSTYEEIEGEDNVVFNPCEMRGRLARFR